MRRLKTALLLSYLGRLPDEAPALWQGVKITTYRPSFVELTIDKWSIEINPILNKIRPTSSL
jgi:hypothetical protein